MEVIRTNSVYKSFGSNEVLKDISIHVNPGEIYGCLGLNGAGKTTLIRIMLGMIRASSGQVTLLGNKMTTSYQSWNEIGYLVETPNSYPNLTVRENLKVIFKLRKLNNPILIDQVISDLKLSQYEKTREKHLSLGNKQRLGLAKSLIHQPKLLILDEPINGLDPAGIVEIRELLKKLASEGATIFLSSHILGEISKLADRIGIIHKGSLVKELTTEELNDQLIKKVMISTNENRKAMELLNRHQFDVIIDENGQMEAFSDRAVQNPAEISRILVSEGIDLLQIYQYTEDLEHYFLRIIEQS